jgi:hypothetical protein
MMHLGNASDCYGPQQWFLCNSTNHVYEEVNEAPHSYTDPESVFIFLVAHGLIHFIWATGSIIGITIGITAKGGLLKKVVQLLLSLTNIRFRKR